MKTTNTPRASRAIHFFFFGLLVFTIASISFATGNAADKQEEMVELKLEISRFTIPFGAPPQVRIENLDQSEQSKRKPLFIPKNANQNIAFKKPVTSEANIVIGELNFITDGEKDGDEGFEVELESELQWVQIDLQKRSEIFAIALWHFYRRERAYRNVIIQISDDAGFKRGVTTVFNTDFENTSKFGAGKDKHYIETNYGKLIPVAGVKGRYVRLYSQGNSTNPGNHYIEVEVYGRDADESAASPAAPAPQAPTIENGKELKITSVPSSAKK
ncbi:MAG: discoidin domain-containing protein [Puniceicoccales bacterium]|jgi:hypothetical protein|nr:discoidin domain-containing protein [Puniceicoccales bacterium]